MKKHRNLTENLECRMCDFKCCRPAELSRHLLTRKHQNRTILNEKNTPNTIPSFVCKKCNKSYKARNSLWYHENKCSLSLVITDKVNSDVIDRILDDRQRILYDNAELRNFIMEQSKITTETVNKALELCEPINNNTIINQTNNKFSINVFLNETCKNAINFSDFLKNIQITYEDLENNAQLGFVNGISKIFLDNLNQLDVSMRPIHCTDVKRETMYIRDDNMWKKQTDDQILQKAIQAVSYKSMGKLAEWKQANPDYMNADSEFSQRCLIIQKHTLAGSERGVYYPKVIHALARETAVEK